jgi:YegS/Rv2252/BmrU family lipid kinase
VRSLALLVNPHAAGGRPLRLLPRVEARLRELGQPFSVQRTQSLLHGCELAREAAARGEVPVTLSGDGLIGAVAGALRDVPDAVLGVLPGGRGNDFARVAGIPRDPVAAVAVLVDGVERPVDLGEVDGRPFIGIASLGFDSEANRRANDAPARLGPLVYAYGALGALVTWRHAAFTVTVDGEERSFEGWSVAAANSKAYGGGMFLAPDASFADGALDVVLSRASSKAHFLRMLPRVFKGTHVADPQVEVLRGAVVRVAADRPFTVYADGDPIGELPATIRCMPAAVRVILPA